MDPGTSEEKEKLTQRRMGYDPAIPLLSMYLENTILQKDACIPKFTTALFTVVRTWK